MSNLLLVRHGESIGNANGIIQGQTDYGLSQSGREGVGVLTNINVDRFNKYNRIICSDLKRTSETAQIINSKVNKPLYYDKLLREVYAGILDGVSKNTADEVYGEYFNIWKKRGDLDKIPFAETGDELQSRVLMFLEQYLYNESDDIIVSHAAFLRSLINTVMIRDRRFQIDLNYDNIYELSDVWSNLDVKVHDIAKNSIVHEITTYEKKYIMKKTNHESIEMLKREKDLLRYLNDYIKTPRIISFTFKSDYNLKVLEYANGINVEDRSLTENEIKNTLREVSVLKQALKRYPYSHTYEDLDISADFLSTLNDINDSKIKSIGFDAYSNTSFRSCLDEDTIQLVHDDLHRNNILYDNEQPVLLDFEGLKNTSSAYQLASHIAINYLLHDNSFNLNYLLKLYPEEVERDYIKSLIIYRLLKGYNFFDKRYTESREKNDYSFVKKYINSIYAMERDR